MAEFAYNNVKNANTNYISFKLDYGYYLQMSYKEKVDPQSKIQPIDKLSAELRQLIIVCYKNFHHTQKLQKWIYGKGMTLRNYTPSNKFWLNSKYIKTKQNQKLEAKLFRPIHILHLFRNEAYKLELLKR